MDNEQNKEVQPNFSMEENKEPEDNNVGMAFLAYILFLLPTLSKSRSEAFVRYHIKQGFVLFLLEIAAIIIGIHYNLFPLTVSLIIFLFLIWSYGIYNVFMGKMSPIPGLGHLVQAIKF